MRPFVTPSVADEVSIDLASRLSFGIYPDSDNDETHGYITGKVSGEAQQ